MMKKEYKIQKYKRKQYLNYEKEIQNTGCIKKNVT